jgi:AcrR family transcriptional regulator
MAAAKPDNTDREQRILDAAADLIIRYGYDKTTMGDIADAAGIGRGVLYLHFHSKDEVLDALIAREFPKYAETWLEHIEADPRGGTIAGLFSSVLYAVNSNPFMAAISKRDKAVFGSYLRKPNNMFASVQARSATPEFVRLMQEAGAVRKDIDARVIGYIMDALSYSLVTAGVTPGWDDPPPFDDLIEAMGMMLDRALTPEEEGEPEAGKAAILQFVASAREQMERAQAARESAARSENGRVTGQKGRKPERP